MWVVLKYKLNEINILKENLNRILGKNPIYFVPKIEYQKNIGNKFKTFQKALLEGYLICFDEKFKDQNIINNLKFCRGIKSLLDGFKNNQNDILNFVKRCKQYQNNKGFLTQNFFENENLKRGKFVTGPFTNLIFDIISKNSSNLEIFIGKYKTTISNKSNYLYRPI